MDQVTRTLITELADALLELRRQHEALTLMFDGLVRGMDELEKQAKRHGHPSLRSVG